MFRASPKSISTHSSNKEKGRQRSPQVRTQAASTANDLADGVGNHDFIAALSFRRRHLGYQPHHTHHAAANRSIQEARLALELWIAVPSALGRAHDEGVAISPPH
jgi:hypothetical protein